MSEQAAPSSIRLAFLDLYETRKYSDLSILCKNQTFLVHRSVVCPQSTFFSRLCDSNFKESQTGVVELKEEEVEDVERLVSFLYTSDYNDGSMKQKSPSSEPSKTRAGMTPGPTAATEMGEGEAKLTFQWIPSSLPVNSDLTAIMDHLCIEKALSTILDAQLNNITMYALADKLDVASLKEVVIKKFASHAWDDWSDGVVVVLREIYESTPKSNRGLRQAAMKFCTNSLERGEALRVELDFVTLCEEIPDIEVDLLRGLLIKNAAKCRETDREYAEGLERMSEKVNEMRSHPPQLHILKKFVNSLDFSRCESLIKAWMRRAVSVLETTSSCRHCHEYLDEDWYLNIEGISLKLRCGSCSTRH